MVINYLETFGHPPCELAYLCNGDIMVPQLGRHGWLAFQCWATKEIYLNLTLEPCYSSLLFGFVNFIDVQ